MGCIRCITFFLPERKYPSLVISTLIQSALTVNNWCTNLGRKLQHNMTSCQGLVPADLKPNHLAKWILPLHKRGILSEFLPFIPPSIAAALDLILPMERGNPGPSPLDEVLLCMAGDNWVIQPVISRGCVLFLTQMGFSHWHEPVFDCVGEGVWAGHSPLTSHLSICVLMYNYASKCAGQIHLSDKRGWRGDERWVG